MSLAYTLSGVSPYLIDYVAAKKSTIKKRDTSDDLERAIKESYAKYGDKFPSTYVERLESAGILEIAKPVTPTAFIGPTEPKTVSLADFDYTKQSIPTAIPDSSPLADITQRAQQPAILDNIQYTKMNEERQSAEAQLRELTRKFNDVQKQIAVERDRVKAQDKLRTEPTEQELRKKSSRYSLLVQEEEQLGAKINEVTTVVQNMDVNMSAMEQEQSEFDPIGEADKNFSGIGDFNPMDLEKEYVPVTMAAESAQSRAERTGMSDTIISPTFSLDSFVKGIPGILPTVEAMPTGLDTRGTINDIDNSMALLEADAMGLVEQPRPSTQQDELDQLGMDGRYLIDGGGGISAYQTGLDEDDLRTLRAIENRTPEEKAEARRKIEQYKRDNNFASIPVTSQEMEMQSLLSTMGPGANIPEFSTETLYDQPRDYEGATILKSSAVQTPQKYSIPLPGSASSGPAAQVPFKPKDPIAAFNVNLSDAGKGILAKYEAVKSGGETLTPVFEAEKFVGFKYDKPLEVRHETVQENRVNQNVISDYQPSAKIDASVESLMMQAAGYQLTEDGRYEPVSVNPKSGFLTSMGYVQLSGGFGGSGKSYFSGIVNPKTGKGYTNQEYFTERGLTVPESLDPNAYYATRAMPNKIDPTTDEGQMIQQIYARQAGERFEDQKQQEYVGKLRRGEVSIADALFNPRTKNQLYGANVNAWEATFGNKIGASLKISDAIPETRRKTIEQFFTQRGISLDETIGSINMKPRYEDARFTGLEAEMRDTSLGGELERFITPNLFRKNIGPTFPDKSITPAEQEEQRFKQALSDYIEQKPQLTYALDGIPKTDANGKQIVIKGEAQWQVSPTQKFKDDTSKVWNESLKESGLGIDFKDSTEMLLMYTDKTGRQNYEVVPFGNLPMLVQMRVQKGETVQNYMPVQVLDYMEDANNDGTPDLKADVLKRIKLPNVEPTIYAAEQKSEKLKSDAVEYAAKETGMDDVFPWMTTNEGANYMFNSLVEGKSVQETTIPINAGYSVLGATAVLPETFKIADSIGKSLQSALTSLYDVVDKATKPIRGSAIFEGKKITDLTPDEFQRFKNVQMDYNKNGIADDTIRVEGITGPGQIPLIRLPEPLLNVLPDKERKDLEALVRRAQLGKEKPVIGPLSPEEDNWLTNMNLQNYAAKISAPIANIGRFSIALGSGIGTDKFGGIETPALLDKLGIDRSFGAIPFTNVRPIDDALTRAVAFFDKSSNVQYVDDIVDRAIGGIAEPTLSQFSIGEKGGIVSAQGASWSGYQTGLSQKFVENKDKTALLQEFQRDPIGWGLNIGANIVTFKFLTDVFPAVYKGLGAVKESSIGARLGIDTILSVPRVQEGLAKAITAVIAQDPLPGGSAATRDLVKQVTMKQLIESGVDRRTAQTAAEHIAKQIADDKKVKGLQDKMDAALQVARNKTKNDPDFFKRIIGEQISDDIFANLPGRLIPRTEYALAKEGEKTYTDFTVPKAGSGEIKGDRWVPTQPLTDWENLLTLNRKRTLPIDKIDENMQSLREAEARRPDYELLSYEQAPSRDIYRGLYEQRNPLASSIQPERIWSRTPQDLIEDQTRLIEESEAVNRKISQIQSTAEKRTREQTPIEQQLEQAEYNWSRARSAKINPLEQELSRLQKLRLDSSTSPTKTTKLDERISELQDKIDSIRTEFIPENKEILTLRERADASKASIIKRNYAIKKAAERKIAKLEARKEKLKKRLSKKQFISAEKARTSRETQAKETITEMETGKVLPIQTGLSSRYKLAQDIFKAVSDASSSYKRKTLVEAQDKLDWAARAINKGDKTDASKALNEFENVLSLKISDDISPQSMPIAALEPPKKIKGVDEMQSIREIMDATIGDVKLSRISPYDFTVVQKTKQARVYSRGSKRARLRSGGKTTNYVIEVRADDVLPVFKQFENESFKPTDYTAYMIIKQEPRKLGLAFKSDARTGQKRGRPYPRQEPSIEYVVNASFQNPNKLIAETEYVVRKDTKGWDKLFEKYPLKKTDDGYGSEIVRETDSYAIVKIPNIEESVKARVDEGEITRQLRDNLDIIKERIKKKEADLDKTKKRRQGILFPKLMTKKQRQNLNKKDQAAIKLDIKKLKDKEKEADELLQKAKEADRVVYRLDSIPELGRRVADTKLNPEYAGNVDLVLQADKMIRDGNRYELKKTAMKYSILRTIKNNPALGSVTFSLKKEDIMDKLVSKNKSTDMIKEDKRIFNEAYNSIITPKTYEGDLLLKEGESAQRPLSLKEGLRVKSEEAGTDVKQFIEKETESTEREFITSYDQYRNTVEKAAGKSEYKPEDINVFVIRELKQYDKKTDVQFNSLQDRTRVTNLGPVVSKFIGSSTDVIKKTAATKQDINYFKIIDDYTDQLSSQVGLNYAEVKKLQAGREEAIKLNSDVTLKDMIKSEQQATMYSKEKRKVVPYGAVDEYWKIESKTKQLKKDLDRTNNDIDFIDYVRAKQNPTDEDVKQAGIAIDRLSKYIGDVENNAEAKSLADEIEKFEIKLEGHERRRTRYLPEEQYPATTIEKLSKARTALDNESKTIDTEQTRLRQQLNREEASMALANFGGTDQIDLLLAHFQTRGLDTDAIQVALKDNEITLSKSAINDRLASLKQKHGKFTGVKDAPLRYVPGTSYVNTIKNIEKQQSEALSKVDTELKRRDEANAKIAEINSQLDVTSKELGELNKNDKYEMNIKLLFSELLDLTGVKDDVFVPDIQGAPGARKISERISQPFEDDLRRAEIAERKVETKGKPARKETIKKIRLVTDNKTGRLKIEINIANTDAGYYQSNQQWEELTNMKDVDFMIKNMRQSVYTTRIQKPIIEAEANQIFDDVDHILKGRPWKGEYELVDSDSGPNKFRDLKKEGAEEITGEEYIRELNDSLGDVDDDIVENFYTKRTEPIQEGIIDIRDADLPPRAKSEPLGTAESIEEQIKQLKDSGIIPTKSELNALKEQKALKESQMPQSKQDIQKTKKYAGYQSRLEKINTMIKKQLEQYRKLQYSGQTKITDKLEIWSGGQNGIDMLALNAAHNAGFKTGGFIPADAKTITGVLSETDIEKFNLVKDTSKSYASRTKKNISETDATVVFGDITSPGTKLTVDTATKLGKPLLVNPKSSNELKKFISKHSVKKLNVAGNRKPTKETSDNALSVLTGLTPKKTTNLAAKELRMSNIKATLAELLTEKKQMELGETIIPIETVKTLDSFKRDFTGILNRYKEVQSDKTTGKLRKEKEALRSHIKDIKDKKTEKLNEIKAIDANVKEILDDITGITKQRIGIYKTGFGTEAAQFFRSKADISSDVTEGKGTQKGTSNIPPIQTQVQGSDWFMRDAPETTEKSVVPKGTRQPKITKRTDKEMLAAELNSLLNNSPIPIPANISDNAKEYLKLYAIREHLSAHQNLDMEQRAIELKEWILTSNTYDKNKNSLAGAVLDNAKLLKSKQSLQERLNTMVSSYPDLASKSTVVSHELADFITSRFNDVNEYKSTFNQLSPESKQFLDNVGTELKPYLTDAQQQSLRSEQYNDIAIHGWRTAYSRLNSPNSESILGIDVAPPGVPSNLVTKLTHSGSKSLKDLDFPNDWRLEEEAQAKATKRKAYKQETAMDILEKQYPALGTVTERNLPDVAIDIYAKTQYNGLTGEEYSALMDFVHTSAIEQYFSKGDINTSRISGLSPDAILDKTLGKIKDKDEAISNIQESVGKAVRDAESENNTLMQFDESGKQFMLRERLGEITFGAGNNRELTMPELTARKKYAAAVAIQKDMEKIIFDKIESLTDGQKMALEEAHNKGRVKNEDGFFDELYPEDVMTDITGVGKLSGSTGLYNNQDLRWMILENKTRNNKTGIGSVGNFIGQRINSFISSEQTLAPIRTANKGMIKDVRVLKTKYRNPKTGKVTEWESYDVSQPRADLVQARIDAVSEQMAEIPDDARIEAEKILNSELSGEFRISKIRNKLAEIQNKKDELAEKQKKLAEDMEDSGIEIDVITQIEKDVRSKNAGKEESEIMEMVLGQVSDYAKTNKLAAYLDTELKFPSSVLETGKGSVRKINRYEWMPSGEKIEPEIITRRGAKKAKQEIAEIEKTMDRLTTVETSVEGKTAKVQENEWSVKLPKDTQNELQELKLKMNEQKKILSGYNKMSKTAKLRQEIGLVIGKPIKEKIGKLATKITEGVDNKELYKTISGFDADTDILTKAKVIREQIKPTARRTRQSVGIARRPIPSVSKIKDAAIKAKYARQLSKEARQLEKLQAKMIKIDKQQLVGKGTVKGKDNKERGLDFYIMNAIGTAKRTKSGNITWDDSIMISQGGKMVAQKTYPLSTRQIATRATTDKSVLNNLVKEIKSNIKSGASESEIRSKLKKTFEFALAEDTVNPPGAGRMYVPRLDTKKGSKLVKNFFGYDEKIPSDAINVKDTNLWSKNKQWDPQTYYGFQTRYEDELDIVNKAIKDFNAGKITEAEKLKITKASDAREAQRIKEMREWQESLGVSVGPQKQNDLSSYLTKEGYTAEVYGDVPQPPKKTKMPDFRKLYARKLDTEDRIIGSTKQLDATLTEIQDYARMQKKGITDSGKLGKVSQTNLRVTNEFKPVAEWVKDAVKKGKTKPKDIAKYLSTKGINLTQDEIKDALSGKTKPVDWTKMFGSEKEKPLPGRLNIGPEQPRTSAPQEAIIEDITNLTGAPKTPRATAAVLNAIEARRRAAQQASIRELVAYGEAESKRKKKYIDATLAGAIEGTIAFGKGTVVNTGYQDVYAMPPDSSPPKTPVPFTPQVNYKGMTLSDQARALAALGATGGLTKVNPATAFRDDFKYGIRSDVIPKFNQGQKQFPITDVGLKSGTIQIPIQTPRLKPIEDQGFKFDQKPVLAEMGDYRYAQLPLSQYTFPVPPATTKPRPRVLVPPPVVPFPMIFTGGSRPTRRPKQKMKAKKKIVWQAPDWWGGYYEPEEYAVQGTKKFKEYSKKVKYDDEFF